MIRLFDTATLGMQELAGRPAAPIGLYVCGPTVYGPPHVGHGRTVLVYDVLRRYLEYRGVAVRHVSNITDVDDKIIDRAARDDRPWRDVAERCEEEWWSAVDRLGVLRPHDRPHATDYVDEMIVFVESLVRRGAAYATPAGVYLRAGRVPAYGLLSHQSVAERRAGARVEPDPAKEDPIDFALWKSAKQGEPSWPSPFGDGRPGWHTECVVMSLSLLGEGFELHGGGQDLIFPHHDNERAQAIADGREFARHWVHSGLVTVSGEKMSKSLGNYTVLSDLLDDADARAYRMLVLGAYYRSPVEVNATTITAAASSVERLDALARRAAETAPVSRASAEAAEARALRARVEAVLDADLDTPAALAELFDGVRSANARFDEGDARGGRAIADAVAELFAALGLEGSAADAVDADTAALVAARDAARRGRDFAAADALRRDLEARGWVVEDTATGTRVHR